MAKKPMTPPLAETRRIRKADEIVSAIDSYGPAVDAGLPSDDGADAAEEGTLQPLRRCVVDTRERLVDAGRGYRSRKADLKGCRMARERASSTLRRGLSTFRDGLSEDFGAKVAVRLGVQPGMPAKPEDLAEHVARVLEQIERGDVTAPEPLDKHAAPLWPLLRAQERSISDFERGLVRLAVASEERSESLGSFDVKVRYVGRALDSFLRLTGLRAEAERLRRALRRL